MSAVPAVGLQLALDFTERRELARCEAVVERGLTTFVEVGEALFEIRHAVAELSEEGMSTRQIGDVLGVDHSTVVRDSGADAPALSFEGGDEQAVAVPRGADAPADAVPDGTATVEHDWSERVSEELAVPDGTADAPLPSEDDLGVDERTVRRDENAANVANATDESELAPPEQPTEATCVADATPDAAEISAPNDPGGTSDWLLHNGDAEISAADAPLPSEDDLGVDEVGEHVELRECCG